ncbi:MAG: hypothetical protein KDI03_00370 [Anaerolineae bacterium]|nr:hypothetical protein [Anaerolineae bacterium]MCB0206260.1 hypothetical protein [Anaerolineae bacterium]
MLQLDMLAWEFCQTRLHQRQRQRLGVHGVVGVFVERADAVGTAAQRDVVQIERMLRLKS